MSHRRRRTSLTLLLSAAMLLGSITPPAVRHSHANGNRDHDHHSAERVTHSHGHHHHGCHTHNHALNHSDEPTESGEATHLHLMLFGFEFHLPKGNGDRTPFENDTDHPTLIHWLGRDIKMTAGIDADFVSRSQFLEAAIDGECFEVSHCSETAQTMRSSLPLCDAARCERSGVQQI